MSRNEHIDMRTGEPTARQIAREIAQQNKLDALVKESLQEVNANGDDDYDGYGRYIGKSLRNPAVLEDIEF